MDLETLSEYDTSESSFELARASGCIQGAVQPWNGHQSFVHEDALRNWTSNRAPLTTIHADSSSETSSNGLYRPIRDPCEIRVIEVKPGSGTSRIQTALHHCSLEFDSVFKDEYRRRRVRYANSLTESAEPLWYTALSYTWGSPIFDKNISVDDRQLSITTSLHTALLHFRHPERSVILWIDQICIDQANNAEKERQIPLMSRIYSHALNTIIWLGVPLRPESNPFDALQRCAINLYMCNDIDSPRDFQRLGLPGLESKEWADIWDVLSKQWFTRVWIMQELILSRDVHVACGRYQTTWRLITDAAMRLVDSGVSNWLVAQSFGQLEDGKVKIEKNTIFDFISYLTSVKHEARSGSYRSDLLSHLIRTRGARCWDPRDKVYGLLGLDFGVVEGFSGSIKPRYDDYYTAAKLFYEVAVDVIRTGPQAQRRIRSLLCEVDHSQEITLTGLPSWVPDWTRQRQTRSILRYTEGGNIFSGLYAAGGKLEWVTDESGFRVPDFLEPEFSFITEVTGSEIRGLCIQGKAVDTVEKLTDVMRKPDLACEKPKDDTLSFNTTLLACYTLSKGIGVYPGAITTVFEAFWRTLIANKEGSGRAQAPDTYGEIFSLLLDATTGHSVDSSPSLPGQTYSVRQRRPLGRGRLELNSLKARKPAETFQEIRRVFRGVLRNRRFGLTKKGYFGLFPTHTEVGDQVGVFAGFEVPFVMRDIRTDAVEGVSLVGECYLHGIMNGEVMENEIMEPRAFSIF